MALHRDIYWLGRQWAVTGSGIQACNQKQKSQFDIEASRLWEDGVLESARALEWLNGAVTQVDDQEIMDWINSDRTSSSIENSFRSDVSVGFAREHQNLPR